MADYTPGTWVDDDGSGTTGTLFSKARMDNIEAGILDAAAHNRIGAISTRPAAAAANKNWLWIATDTDGTGGLYFSDGSTWTKMLVGTLSATATRFGTAGEIRSGTVAAVFSQNHDTVADRQIDNTKPSWRMLLDTGGSDVMYWQHAPATNASVAPTWTTVLAVDSAGGSTAYGSQTVVGDLKFGSGGLVRSGTAYSAEFDSNYNAVTNRLIDTSKPCWSFAIGTGSDLLGVWRAPATTGAPVFTQVLTIDSTGNLISTGVNPRFGVGASLNGFAAEYAAFGSNYNGVTDRHINTAKPAWRVELDGRTGFDTFAVFRSAPTAGAPTWVEFVSIDASANVSFGTGGTLSSPTADNAKMCSNYNATTDRLIDTSKAAWQQVVGTGGDSFTVWRAPATAGAPVWAMVLQMDSSGVMTQYRVRRGTLAARPAASGTNKGLYASSDDSVYVNDDGANWERIASLGSAAFFGDGSDGDFTADGTAAMAGATRSGSVYTLTRDVYYHNLTVNTGVTVTTAGFKVFVSGTLAGAGSIINNGTAASGRTAGSGGAAGTVRGGYSGGAGGNTGAVGTTPAPSPGTYGEGGNGGGGGAGTGFAAGSPATPTLPPGGVRRALPEFVTMVFYDMTSMQTIGGGGGGGGGGGAAAGQGGGGGGGGGVVVVCARKLSGTISFSAIGGNGANGIATNGGGGGGGGGGAIHVLCGDKTGWTGTTAVTGGSAGTGNGTGATGTAGSAGVALVLTG